MLHVDGDDGAGDMPLVREGHGFTFTIGRGNDLAVGAARAIGDRALGLDLADVTHDLGGFARATW